MTTVQVIVIALVILVGVTAAGLYLRRRHSAQLRSRFGPEYARAVEERGGPGKAERELERREKRVEHYHLKPLSGEQRQRFGLEWRQVQALFVDSPKAATARADDLLGQVMSARGYPDGPFENRLADLSVDHPDTVQGYRDANAIVARRDRGEATTEDMRQVMIQYRTLFDELLGEPEGGVRAAE